MIETVCVNLLKSLLSIQFREQIGLIDAGNDELIPLFVLNLSHIVGC
jgi:hypothetical protein